jgi:hypothetical protein
MTITNYILGIFTIHREIALNRQLRNLVALAKKIYARILKAYSITLTHNEVQSELLSSVIAVFE